MASELDDLSAFASVDLVLPFAIAGLGIVHSFDDTRGHACM
jgi:hypothetical protein